MNVNTGEIKEIVNNEEIDEETVACPHSGKAQAMMTCWGKKKRRRYAELIKIYSYKCHEAFYFVEFNNGKEL